MLVTVGGALLADIIWPLLASAYWLPLMSAFYYPFIGLPVVIASFLVELVFMTIVWKRDAAVSRVVAAVIIANLISWLVGIVLTSLLSVIVPPNVTDDLGPRGTFFEWIASGLAVSFLLTVAVEGFFYRRVRVWLPVKRLWRVVFLGNALSYGLVTIHCGVVLFLLFHH